MRVEPRTHSLRFLFPLVPLVVLAPLGVGCVLSSAANDPCADGACDSSRTIVGPKRGVRADGRVDIDARSAWPNRSVEPSPLSNEEVAKACAIVGACGMTSSTSTGSTDDETRAMITALCTFPEGSEERAVPKGELNERWSWEARALIAAGSCDAAKLLGTKRASGLQSEEDGVWWASSTDPIPRVSCAADVATLVTNGKTSIRDCARAFAHCDARSPTGCTDRAPVACDSKGIDRCDGDVKLGCDASGKVSFHDCARVAGGKCVESATGAKCVYPDAASCQTSDQVCDGQKLTVCVSGAKVSVDCNALGMGGCNRGHCVGR